MVTLGIKKEKETYLARFRCTYLVASQMIRVKEKYKSNTMFHCLEGQSEMRKLSMFKDRGDKSVSFYRVHGNTELQSVTL